MADPIFTPHPATPGDTRLPAAFPLQIKVLRPCSRILHDEVSGNETDGGDGSLA